MIRVAVVGDIGSGKSFVAKLFGYPVFNADQEVSNLYKKDKKCYTTLKKKLPKFIFSFPIKKSEILLLEGYLWDEGEPKKAFEKAIKKALEFPVNIDHSVTDITLNIRAKKILNLIM